MERFTRLPSAWGLGKTSLHSGKYTVEALLHFLYKEELNMPGVHLIS